MAARGWPGAAEAVAGTESTRDAPTASNARSSGGAAAPKRLLEGCWFTLAAMEAAPAGAVAPGDLSRAEVLLKKAGARLFDHRTAALATAQSKPGQRYAMCPPSHGLTREDAAALAASRPDFKFVPDAQRVTPRWVQESLAAGELQSLALPNNRLIYRPLPYRTPLPAFQDLKLCASVYGIEEKRYLVLLAHMLGAQFTSNMRAVNTHLLVPRRVGNKYAQSGKNGVTPVVAAWLIDAAATGTVPDVNDKRYQPGPPAEGEEEAVHLAGSQAGAAAGAVGVENTQGPRSGSLASQPAVVSDTSAGAAGAHSIAQGASTLHGGSALTERDANCPPSSRPMPCRPLELLRDPDEGRTGDDLGAPAPAAAAARHPSAADQPPAAPAAAAARLTAAAAVPASAAAAQPSASIPGTLPGSHPAAASAAAAAAAAPAAAAGGDLAAAPIGQQPAQPQDQQPPPKPKASLLDTLLPPDTGSRRSRRSAARASAAGGAQARPPAAAGTPARDAAAAGAQAATAAAAQAGAGSGTVDAPARPDSGAASKAALLRHAVAAAAATQQAAADGSHDRAGVGSQMPVPDGEDGGGNGTGGGAGVDDEDAAWDSLNGLVERQRCRPVLNPALAPGAAASLASIAASQMTDAFADDPLPALAAGIARQRPNRRLSAGDSDGNSRGSGGRKQEGRKRHGGPEPSGRGSKAARAGDGGGDGPLASQLEYSQRVEYEVAAPARAMTRRGAAVTATDDAAEASRARIARLVNGRSGGTDAAQPPLSATAAGADVSLQL